MSHLQQQQQQQEPGSVPRESDEHGAVAAKAGVEGAGTSPSSDALDIHPVISAPSDISASSSVSSMSALTSETATATPSVEFTKGSNPNTGSGTPNMMTLTETKVVASGSKNERVEAKDAGYPKGGTEGRLVGDLDSGIHAGAVGSARSSEMYKVKKDGVFRNGGKEATATPVKSIASLKASKLDCAHGENLESSYSDVSSEDEDDEETLEGGEPRKGATIVKALVGLAGKEASQMANRGKYASSTDKLDLSV